MKNKLNRLSALLLVVLCMTSFSISAFAADGGHFASNENGTEIPPNSIDSITVSTENVELPEKSTDTSLTPNGNMTLIDDILQKSPYASDENKQQEKQFITVQTKNGNYFYLVVDRTGETENVYFLNLVDEADLMALTEELGDSTVELVDCRCSDKCSIGAINSSCEICRANMSECMGKEPVKPEPEVPSDTEGDAQEPAQKQASSALLLLVLILIVGGGAALYWFKLKNKKASSAGDRDLTDYDFGDDDEEEETEIDDADAQAEQDE
ncbi:MAG: DUF4366 domain-containing protein [Oscillospiraceae bacterium]|nr:DUF4366 domain-containing protein [Oscillospiraceae bacterium]